MQNKLAVKILAVILSLVTVFTLFSACADDDKEPVDKSEGVSAYSPEWLIKPSIAAQAIYPIVRADFNENTNHYDISYADCFKIMLNGKYGIIDYNGQIVVPAEYDEIFAIRNSDDFIGIQKGDESDKQTYIHSDTFETQRAYKKYNSYKYEYYWRTDSSSALFVKTEGASTTKEEFSPSLPETVKGVNVDGSKYTPTGKFGLYVNSVNVTGMVYDGAGVFSNGLVAFESNGKWGYINSSGKTVVPFEYDAVWNYNALGGEDTPYECSEGHITVCKDKKFGILKDDGTVLVKPVYEDATPVINGMAFAKSGGKWGVILLYGNGEEITSNSDTTSSTSSSTSSSSSTTESTSSTQDSTSTTTEESTTTTKETTTQKSQYKTGAYTIKLSSGGSLNLRSEADLDSSVVTSLYDGTVVYVDKVSGGWGHTVYKGKEGWFSLKYAEGAE